MPRVVFRGLAGDLFNFSSRANRTEYARFNFGLYAIYQFTNYFELLKDPSPSLTMFAVFAVMAVFMSFMSMLIRRLRDTSLAQEYLILFIVPHITFLMWCILFFVPSKKKPKIEKIFKNCTLKEICSYKRFTH
jgi:uncharacterized membrane protein YhaH (DUF805 family)